ncbi:MAG TPA: error-prone DNA polymerase [Acidimicrobiales bacterium]|nr:error-prone DNA polymerase [Acidimicrobiales bacterium]
MPTSWPANEAAGGWRGPTTDYAELHCHSNFSFLDGASHPEELAAEAVRLGLRALALTDHHGLYGAVRFAQAARAVGLPTVFGAELTLASDAPRTAVVDPRGHHVVVLARDPQGYARLSRAIAEAHLAGGEKGRPVCTIDDLAGRHDGHWLVLTGCRKGTVPAALHGAGPSAARRALDELVGAFGQGNVAVELWDHGDPVDAVRNDALAQLAVQRDVDVVATNNVHYATPSRRPLSEVLAAVRSGRPLEDLQGWLPAAATASLRSGAEQERRFARWPGVVARAGALGRACAFDLHLLAPGLPDFLAPDGYSDQSWLAELTRRGALARYGPRHHERVPGAWAQIDHELEVIANLGYAGYFLIVWDIVEFCRRHDIYCQGRGSAANSAVCYALGITRADAVALGLLFERFLSPERDGPPDIDVDIESGRRQEVIAYVYERYGRQCAAQVANVITYRARSAVRDVGKALGHPPDQVDVWAKALDGGDTLERHDLLPPPVREMAQQVLDFPRHLGLHSGGMVICDRPVVEVCPVEWARHPGRTVLQWDKEDCAAAGLVKFDLLGLGMLDALHRTVDLVCRAHEVDIDLALLEQEDAVYDMLCRADTVGVFQVESRAQMATLPRIKPRCFSDLVVEVAIIRPGPIQGGSVHPYIRRRQGVEAPDPPHPLLQRALAKTLGVPLFQEQLMQIAIDAAGFTGAQADELRQAMSAKRSGARMDRLRTRLFDGMAGRGITGTAAEEIFAKLSAFASFGFPESHAVSFAYLVYASAWLKLHYPAAFCAALLNAQPMGFWAPQSLVADARRHGVTVKPPHVDHSGAEATLEWDDDTAVGPSRRQGQPAVRLGLGAVRTVGQDLADRVARERPYRSVEDLVRRAGVGRAQLEALASAGALQDVPSRPGGRAAGNRRQALWAAGALAQGTPERLPGLITGEDPPPLADLTALQEVEADLWATGVMTGTSAMELARPRLDALGVIPAAALAGAETDGKVVVAGVVTHRQRPGSARGTVFLNLEDDTGMVNVICSPGAWERWRQVARRAPALVVRGRLERTDGVVSVVAEKITALDLGTPTGAPARHFR